MTLKNYFQVHLRPFGLLFDFSVLASILTAAGFLGRLWWVLDIVSWLRFQSLLLLLTSSLLYLIGGKKRTAAIFGVFALLNAYSVLPLYLKAKSPQAPPGAPHYRAALANVERFNQDYGKLRDFIRQERPDFAVLLEVNPVWRKELEDLYQDYPFSQDIIRLDCYGIIFLSRVPVSQVEFRKIGEKQLPALVARIELGGKTLTVIGAHPYPPKGFANSFHHYQHLDQLAYLVKPLKPPVMFLADMNMPSFSPFFADFLRVSGLHDSRRGFGLEASWPTYYPPPFRITLDHILVSDGVRVLDRHLGPDVGSDHFPVVMDFSL